MPHSPRFWVPRHSNGTRDEGRREQVRCRLISLQKKFPACKVVKVSTRATPDMDNKVEVVRKKLQVTFKKHSRELEQESIDLDTLIRVYLKNRYIGENFEISSTKKRILQKHFIWTNQCLLMICCSSRIRRTLQSYSQFASWLLLLRDRSPKVQRPSSGSLSDISFSIRSELQVLCSKHSEYEFRLVFVSSQRIDQDTIDVVMYNPVHQYCNFK